jgi:uncharacterized protein
MTVTAVVANGRIFALTAAVAVFSGNVAAWVGLPVPWLLGALFGTAALALAGVRMALPGPVKPATHAAIGLILGASITPETFDRVAQWPLSLALMSVGMIIMTCATALYYVRVAGYDRLTAAAASLTGGLTNVVSIAIDLGANPANTVIGQLFRLTAIVVIMPLGYTVWLGTAPDVSRTAPGIVLSSANLWVILLAWPAYALARRLHLPVADMMGPLLASAVCAMLGNALVLPVWAVGTVFAAVGALIGIRFYGLHAASLLRAGGHAAMATLILLTCSALLAYPFAQAAGVPYSVALLAVAPGGVAEIAIMATILGMDPVFVTFHQIFRNLILNALAPAVLTRLRHRPHAD